MEYEEIRELLAVTATAHGSGATETEIREAEESLGAFPHDYRQYLREFGWVTLGHYELYGLGWDVPDYLNVLRMTLAERNEPEVPLPATYVCLMNDGGGNLMCYDSTLSIADGDIPPILLWDHELGVDQTPEVISNSFADWLRTLIESIS